MSVNDAAAAGWVKGVDGSYTQLTPAAAARLRAAGVDVWWQCLWTGAERPATAISNLTVARDAGMTLAGYGSVTSRNPGWWHAEKTREGVPDDLWAQLRVVPCDVELPGIPDATIRDFIERMFTHGKRRAIYTSYGHWTGEQGDSRGFTDCLLCNAYWDQNPDVDFVVLPYGGWSADQVLLEQYTGGDDVEGVFVDRDVWNRQLLYDGESEDPMDAPTKGEFQALYRMVDAHYKISVALAGAIIALAQEVYGDQEPRLNKLRLDFDELNTRAAIAFADLPAMDTS